MITCLSLIGCTKRGLTKPIRYRHAFTGPPDADRLWMCQSSVQTNERTLMQEWVSVRIQFCAFLFAFYEENKLEFKLKRRDITSCWPIILQWNFVWSMYHRWDKSSDVICGRTFGTVLVSPSASLPIFFFPTYVSMKNDVCKLFY